MQHRLFCALVKILAEEKMVFYFVFNSKNICLEALF